MRTDFNVGREDIDFFIKLLKTEPNENKIIFKKSNIFFRGENDELLFLNKIYNSKFFYDSFNLENLFTSKNEIFNIPYKLTIKNDKFNKNIFMKFNSKKIRLDIENTIDYNDEVKKGLVELLFINKNIFLDYQIKKNSLSFSSENKKTLNGFIDFKPFFLKADLFYDGISTKNLFNPESFLIDLIKSEVLNNENLNIDINLNVDDITNLNELNDLYLNIGLDQGEITLSKSKVMWKNNLEISLKQGLVNYDKDEISLVGKLLIKAKNINDFYKSFQVKKVNRKKINEIELDFVYNFNEKMFLFDNVKIDKKSNNKIDKFINKYNSNKKKFFNKITFKNFINDFFKVYSG